MLTTLLKKLKTQQTTQSPKQQEQSISQYSSPENKHPNFNLDELYNQIKQYNIENNYKIVQQPQQTCYDTQIPISRVRYFMLEKLPEIGPLIRNCKFGKFCELVHSRRKVKELRLVDYQGKQNYGKQLERYPMPQYLKFMQPLLIKQVPTYNHILINDYPPGIGIMPHTDGPMYYNRVIVLSLQSSCIINFTPRYTTHQNHSYQILLQPNSIHIFEQDAYTNYLHGIQNKNQDIIYLCYSKQLKQVIKSTICNFNLLGCRKIITDGLQNYGEGVPEMAIKTNYGTLRIYRTQIIIDEYKYNFALKIKRRQRISVTIRQKYSEESKRQQQQ